MEWLIGSVAVVAFILWVVWNSGKEKGLQEAARKQLQTNGAYERQIERLDKEKKDQSIEILALKAAIRDVKAHLDALRGDAVYFLEVVRSTKPPKLLYAEPFLLLAPGSLHRYADWARSAGALWRQVDQLSSQSRRALEEASLAPSESDLRAGAEATNTPLLQDVLLILHARPPELEVNLFDFSTYDFDELSQWFDTLAQYSRSYVMRVSQVESEMRREKARLATAATMK